MNSNSIKGQIFDIKITGISSDGRGIGHLDGLTVFVPNALPNEIVSVLIIKVKTNFCIGKLLKVIIQSPYRVKALCPDANRCGGCDLLHCSYPYQLELKQQILSQTFKHIGRFDDPPISRIIGMLNPIRYRNKMSLPVSVYDNKPVMGFYSRHSHTIVSIADCLTAPEINSQIIRHIAAYIHESGIRVYDENSRGGLLRHVLIRIGFSSGEVMICLVINGESIPKPSMLINLLKNNITGFTTLILNSNTARTNVILGAKTRLLYGPGVIHDYIGDLSFEISPVSFYQVNPIQTKVLYDTVLEFADLTGRETVIDAFCGIGTISLCLARRAGHVYGIEIVAEAVNNANHNAIANGVSNVTFFNDSAESWLSDYCKQNNIKPDITVLDPPRKGCEAVLLQAIAAMRARKVIYVSCDMGTLARDARILTDMGYILQRLQPVDMFPNTRHVEAVMLLQWQGI